MERRRWPYGRWFPNRMDASNLEPGDWVLEGLTGMRPLLRRDLRRRWRGTPGHPYEQGFDLRLWPERLHQPLKWQQPRLIFTNSMSDLFHEVVPSSSSGRCSR